MKRSAWRYIWAAGDIRKRILITILILAIYRLAAHVPVPGANREAIARIYDAGGAGGTLVGLINLLWNNDVYIEGAVTVVAKREYGGIARIQEETGIDVHRILDVSVAADRTKVAFDRYGIQIL